MKKNHAKVIAQVAMLVALQIVLSRFLSIKTESIRIGFGFVPMVLCGMLFGPYWAAVAYATSDILGAFLFDMGVFPGITLARIVSGLIYGFILHRADTRFFPHVISAVLLGKTLFAQQELLPFSLPLHMATHL